MNRKMMTIAAFASAAVLAIVGVAFVNTNPFAQAQQTEPQQQTPDFNALIKEKLKGSLQEDFLSLEANVIYQSDKRVVLEGEKIIVQTPGSMNASDLSSFNPEDASLVENTNIWRAVELIEGYGYHVDQVELTGQGSQGNPHDYLIVMSK